GVRAGVCAGGAGRRDDGGERVAGRRPGGAGGRRRGPPPGPFGIRVLGGPVAATTPAVVPRPWSLAPVGPPLTQPLEDQLADAGGVGLAAGGLHDPPHPPPAPPPPPPP